MSFLRCVESNLVSLSQITSSSKCIKIKVHILYLSIRPVKTGDMMDMILVDAEGTRIHASIDPDASDSFRDILRERSSWVMDTFKVSPNTHGSSFRTTPHPCRISLYETTEVNAWDDAPPQFPEKYIADFSDISLDKLDRTVLIDVIGRFVYCGQLQKLTSKAGKPLTKVDVTLQDASGSTMVCTLWGKYGDQALEYYNAYNGATIICLFRFMQITEFRGIHVSTAYNNSRIFFDPKLIVAATLRSSFRSLPQGEMPIAPTGDRDVSKRASVSLHDEFFILNTRKTVQSIIDTREISVCVTAVTINSIEPSWYFIGCGTCEKSVVPYPFKAGQTPMFKCKSCGNVSNVHARYRVVLHVSDETYQLARFVVYEPLAKFLFNNPADNLAEEVADAGPGVLPEALNILLGKKMLLKVVISSENLENRTQPYKIDKYWFDPAMVDKFIADVQLPPSIPSPSVSSPSVLPLSSKDDVLRKRIGDIIDLDVLKEDPMKKKIKIEKE